MKNLIILLVGFFASLASQAEIIEFKLQTEDQSCKGLSKLVVSQDKTVLYHLNVPASGTGRVNLLTGTYQVDIANNDCADQQVIQISDLPNSKIEFKLSKQLRKPAVAAVATSRDGNNYAYSGDVILDKANIYFAGKDDGKFNLKFSTDNFLASVPTFKEKDLEAELRHGHIYAENVFYPQIFYQTRISDQNLQNSAGFCGTRKEIFQFMVEGLKKYEFPQVALTDLSNYLPGKVPEAEKYCVYPQAHAQLEKAIPLEVTFVDQSTVRTERLFYLVIPQNKNGRTPSSEKFSAKKPKNLWKHYTRTVIPKTPYLYEWSVGFIVE